MFSISVSNRQAQEFLNQGQRATHIFKKGSSDPRYVLIFEKNSLIGKIQNIFKIVLASLFGYSSISLALMRNSFTQSTTPPAAAASRVAQATGLMTAQVESSTKPVCYNPRQVAAIKAELSKIQAYVDRLDYAYNLNYAELREFKAQLRTLLADSNVSQGYLKGKINDLHSKWYSVDSRFNSTLVNPVKKLYDLILYL